MSKEKFLLDVNVAVALADENHAHHETVTQWFDSQQEAVWGLCLSSETGFMRVTTLPSIGGLSMEEATEILTRLAEQPGYMFWSTVYPWSEIATLFAGRIVGHQQVTDACLLGLAIKQDGVLVTLDKAVRFLAGTEFSKNLLVLE